MVKHQGAEPSAEGAARPDASVGTGENIAPNAGADPLAMIDSSPSANTAAGDEVSSAASESAATESTGQQTQPKRPHNLDHALAILQGSQQETLGSPILRLASIRLEGTDQIRPGFLLSVLRPYVDPLASLQPWSEALYAHRTSFTRPAQPATLQGLLALTQSIGADLSAFDLFHDVTARFEPCRHPLASEEDVDIVLQCAKKGRMFLKSSTDIGNGEGSASVQGRVRNLFGGAETLEGNVTFGTRTRRAFNLHFSSPVMASPVLSALLSAYTTEQNLSVWSSASMSSQGLRAALSYTGRPFVQREFAAEASWRHLHAMPQASTAMRRLSGDSVKAALTHTWVRDTRDDPTAGTSGSYLKAVQELAGFGGCTSFVKLEGEAQTSRRVLSRVIGGRFYTATGSLGLRAGFLRTLDAQPSLYADRLQLGGPSTLRMFRANGLGPQGFGGGRIGGDALGGDALWAAGASVIADLPGRPEWPLKLHAFLNAGQLCQLDQAAPLVAGGAQDSITGKPAAIQSGALAQAARELSQPSVSAGIGLLYTQGALRVELNAGVPLVARRGDAVRKGLQFGIGVSFL